MKTVKKIARNFSHRPIHFIMRQVYKVCVVLPYQLVVSIVSHVPHFSSDKHLLKIKDCFIITSVIFSRADKAVSHKGIRSRFSAEENARQTARTIESIRSKVPQAKIVLVEGGLKSTLPFGLEQHPDLFLYVGDQKLVRLACDSKNKSLGEAMILLAAIKKLPWQAEYYFKISGRYYLNDRFNIAMWRHPMFMFYAIREDFFSTRLYGFYKNFFPLWRLALIRGLPLACIDYAIENTLSKFIPKKDIYKLTCLGVSGASGSSDDVIEE